MKLQTFRYYTMKFSFLFSLFLFPIAVFSEKPSIESSVIRVNVTAQSYNLYQPWEKGSPMTRRGLGAVVAPGKVLVTGQMVADSTYVELEHARSGEKTTAKVDGVDYEANLALLSLVDKADSFLDGFVPLPLGKDLKAGTKVEVWQVEENGTPITTDLELVRTEVGPYVLDGAFFLAYQLRGSLQGRGGSFTLPVVHGDELVGMILDYSSKDQIARTIPSSIVRHFMDDLADGDYGGFPGLGIRYERTLDEQLRAYLRMEEGSGGVYVSTVVPGSSAASAGLKVGDVILSMGGYTVDSRGNYDHPLHGKLNFSHILRGESFAGDKMVIRVWRDGKPLELTAEMKKKKASEFLVDSYLFDRGPRFVIEGGLVFQELTKPYLTIFGKEWQTRAPLKLLYALNSPEEFEKKGLKKVVFLSRVIRTPATNGYEQISHLIVTKVNGKAISRLSDLAEALKTPVDGLHKIEFSEAPGAIYLDAALSDAVNQRISEAFRIPNLQRLD